MTDLDLNAIDTLVRLMHRSLEALTVDALRADVVESSGTLLAQAPRWRSGHYRALDLSGDPLSLLNTARTLVNNIGAIKDNLRLWCESNGKDFKGEELINANAGDVAVIHDLWNRQKHGYSKKQKRPARSGRVPELNDLSRRLVLGSPAGGGPSGSMMVWEPGSPPRYETVGGGTAHLVLVGEIIDKRDGALMGISAPSAATP